ncbi:MAG: arginine--tRNA ligase [Lachnospiraceae bacterium]|nr:arginine--tRNA ligase [Lachnospiraceae bacterium]
MKKLTDIISDKVKAAFEAAGYDADLGIVGVSNRPDLCEYQCNGAMAAAKKYKKAPIAIANEVIEKLDASDVIEAQAVAPGFINININRDFLTKYIAEMDRDPKMGAEPAKTPLSIVVDYGGANVAKPLHVGHLRPAVIGESIKRMFRFMGNKVVGDAHLGDWGLQIGLIIAWLEEKQPDLPYFDPDFKGEYPKEAPFTPAELEVIYPAASKHSKEDADFLAKAQNNVFELQNGNRGYFALWEHIMNTSVPDIKRVYGRLNVDFDVWKTESDARHYIPDMIEKMKADGFAHIDNGALVVDVKEETDTKEMPPVMLLKSNGATLYDTTDLATIVERMKLFAPDHIVYVVDKRQDLYFERVFRAAHKTGIVKPETRLSFIGNGTMNGADGKPFKTRDGGVMRLEMLIDEINGKVYDKVMSNRETSEEEARAIATKVGLAALKYGDLSNQATKDYIFDVDRFTSFEGNTGPYILYTMVRIKSILAKAKDENINVPAAFPACTRSGHENSEVNLMLTCARFNDMIEHAAEEMAPHKVCQFMYQLADGFNTFYHENKILTESDETKRNEWLALIVVVLKLLEICTDLIGIEAPDRM